MIGKVNNTDYFNFSTSLALPNTSEGGVFWLLEVALPKNEVFIPVIVRCIFFIIDFLFNKTY